MVLTFDRNHSEIASPEILDSQWTPLPVPLSSHGCTACADGSKKVVQYHYPHAVPRTIEARARWLGQEPRGSM